MRAVIIVIDSFGIGELPDAGKYGDEGSNTILHICETVKGEKWSVLKKMGLGNASLLLGNELPGCEAINKPLASFGVMNEKSPGKDTTTGHWELAGLELEAAFTTFPPEYPSFPQKLLEDFIRETNRDVIGNKAASGTAIIEELGKEHMETGKLIVYTSGDSVFQVAAHENIVTLDELYDICAKARNLCDHYNVGRVIARPFVGEPGSFTRTNNRRDYSIKYEGETIFDFLQKKGVNTIGVGKIGDIFLEKSINESYHDKGNDACIKRTEELLSKPAEDNEFVFVNYVDTDMLYGHRRNPQGYCDEVEKIDKHLDRLIEILREDELFIITADHGCDPTFKGTDHTREYVPLLSYQKGSEVINLGIRNQFSDVTATIVKFFRSAEYPRGISFL
ncbi:MAG: phosphopentomutase [Candidatus Cloacimonadota bacterium]|nr:phosphopentomutase [Candidatus Cloacimonadota bacterium]